MNRKLNTRQFLKHRNLHALAKLAVAEGIELWSISGRVWHLLLSYSQCLFSIFIELRQHVWVQL